MFRAYDADREKSPEVVLEWLQNQSYTAAGNAKESSSCLSFEKGSEQNDQLIGAGINVPEFGAGVTKRIKGRNVLAGSPSGLKKAGAKPSLGHDNQAKLYEDAPLPPKDGFHVDKKPDRSNLAFKALHYVHIAKYTRKTSCLGLHFDQRRFYSNSGCIPHKTGRKQVLKRRYYSRLKSLYSEANILQFSKVQGCKVNSPTSFLPLGQPETATLNSSIASALNLSTDGNALKPTDYCLPDGAPEIPVMESKEQLSCRITMEFNKKLRESPHDISKWIEFVEFQDDVKRAFWSTSNSPEMYITEKKLAILDKAIASNPSSVELQLRRLELCGSIWDANRLNEEWKKLLFLHPNNIALWKKYLMFLQTQFSTFSISRIVKFFSTCFEKLKRILDGSFLSHAPLPRMEEQMIDIFSHFCFIMGQSGYQERAIANFQALIEFNFYTPTNLINESAPFDQWLAFFEPFWDSGVPRFGEDGALGWKHTMEHKEAPILIEKAQDENEDDLLQSSLSTSENWLRLECYRDSRHWLPLKPSESVNASEDSDRTILFDDIFPVLFCLKKQNAKYLLILRFLDFLGVAMEPHLQFICGYMGCHDPICVQQENQLLFRDTHFMWRFSSSTRNESCLNMFNILNHRQCKSYQRFIERVIKQSITQFSRQYQVPLVTLLLGQMCKPRNTSSVTNEVSKNVQKAKKFVKQLLKTKEKRNDLRLFCEYGKLEWQFGNISDSRKVFSAAISSVFGSASCAFEPEDESSLDLCHLHRVAAELELSEEIQCTTKLRSTKILVNLGNVGHTSTGDFVEVSPSSILKSRSRYQSVLNNLLEKCTDFEGDCAAERNLLSNGGQLLTEWTICFALFQYVTEGLVRANDVFEKTIRTFEEKLKGCDANTTVDLDSLHWKRLNCELLYMSYVKLNVLHNNNNTSPLTSLRVILMKALHLFPENPHFNDLFLDIESKTYIAGRVRRHYDSMFRSDSKASCFSLMYAIIMEMERHALLKSQESSQGVDCGDARGDLSSVNRIRNLLIKAVGLPSMKNCVLFWRLYIKFEVLYFDGLHHFPEALEEISDLMTEKEIRVRAPLEEVLILVGSK